MDRAILFNVDMLPFFPGNNGIASLHANRAIAQRYYSKSKSYNNRFVTLYAKLITKKTDDGNNNKYIAIVSLLEKIIKSLFGIDVVL